MLQNLEQMQLLKHVLLKPGPSSFFYFFWVRLWPECCSHEHKLLIQKYVLSKVLKLHALSPSKQLSWKQFCLGGISSFLFSSLLHPNLTWKSIGSVIIPDIFVSNEDRGAKRLPRGGFREDTVQELYVQTALKPSSQIKSALFKKRYICGISVHFVNNKDDKRHLVFFTFLHEKNSSANELWLLICSFKSWTRKASEQKFPLGPISF